MITRGYLHAGGNPLPVDVAWTNVGTADRPDWLGTARVPAPLYYGVYELFDDTGAHERVEVSYVGYDLPNGGVYVELVPRGGTG